MEIVANTNILRKFHSVDVFKLDLGNNLKGPAPISQDVRTQNQFKIKITDAFIRKYMNINEKVIYKYGEIGTLRFYQDLSVPFNEIHVYNGDDIFEIEFENPTDGDYKKYLNELLKYVESQKKSDNEDGVDSHFKKDNSKSGKMYTNMPDYIERPDIHLDKDNYVEQMIERRKKLSAIDE